MDLTRDITYRGFTLNDEDFTANIVPGAGSGKGIVGCVVDSVDFSDVDVIQFIEKRSQQDGMDAGDVFLGTRRIRLAGTLYNVTRRALYDDLATLRAALSPVLAQREEPLDYGYRPLYFSWPTNRLDDYPALAIDLMVKAMPRAFQSMFVRDQLGGEDNQAVAIPWQATFLCRDPSIMAATPVDITHSNQTEVTATNATYSDDYINGAHTLVNGNRIRFTTLAGSGTGLALATTYYVVSSSANKFKVSLSLDGSPVNIATANYTGVQYLKSLTTSGELTNRGTYLCPVNGLWVVGLAGGQIVAAIGDSTFTITIPSSANARVIRYKGEDKVLTLEEVDSADTSTSLSSEVPRYDLITFTYDTTWPLIDPGTSDYSVTVHGCGLMTGSHFWFYERYA